MLKKQPPTNAKAMDYHAAMKILLMTALAGLVALQTVGCSKESGASKSEGDEKPKKKTLEQREEALYKEFLKLADAYSEDCAKFGKKARALIEKESDTIEEINDAYNEMSAKEKAAKKKEAQERNVKNKASFDNAFICSVSNKDVAAAYDKIVPATK